MEWWQVIILIAAVFVLLHFLFKVLRYWRVIVAVVSAVLAFVLSIVLLILLLPISLPSKLIALGVDLFESKNILLRRPCSVDWSALSSELPPSGKPL